MSPEQGGILDRYRTLWRQAESQRAKAEELKTRSRELSARVSELESAVRLARGHYQQVLPRHVAGQGDEHTVNKAKEDLAQAEADLAEAKGMFQALQAQLPKVESQIPSAGEVELARRAAWEVIYRDLLAQVPKEVPQLLAKIYAALLEHHRDAAFPVALLAMCPEPPSRRQCAQLIEQLAAAYDISP
ncbi:MAG: hypothetical protein ACREIS_12360 [Nitrospiraceae bacterium]